MDATKNNKAQSNDDFYKTLLESTNAIPWRIDWKTMTFSYIGPQIEQLLGWKPESWISAEDWANRMHEEDRAWVIDYCVAQSKAGLDHEADYRALTKSGEYVWIRDVVHVMRDENGEVEALIGFMFDISERKKNKKELLRLQKELEEFSYKDGLTEIANRRMFDSILSTEWRAAQRHQKPLSLLFIDIDYFKQYNDIYGHIQGDTCLKQFAKILKESIERPRDFVARYGGEEFVIVLPETDTATAASIAERCLTLISDHKIEHKGSKICDWLTASIGVGSMIPSPKDHALSFVERVDKSTYQAKKNGRNTIVYTPQMSNASN